jgi:hypothetical protein
MEEEHERGGEEDLLPRDGDEDLPLLDGEHPATPYLEDAEHWVAVYQELVSFYEWLLETPPRSRHDAEQANLIGSRRDHAVRRLSYWHGRLTDHVEARDRPGGEGA